MRALQQFNTFSRSSTSAFLVSLTKNKSLISIQRRSLIGPELRNVDHLLVCIMNQMFGIGLGLLYLNYRP
jgi:hypothetical protein